MRLGDEPVSWRESAACWGTRLDLFFPPKGQIKVTRQAKKICLTCPVKAECLDYAQTHHPLVGIWGGLSERERRNLRRRRAA